MGCAVRLSLFGVVALLFGCLASEDESAECRARFSAERGYGFASDPPICAAPPPPAPEPECPPATPESVAAECTAAGVECPPSRFVTRDAALCIARENG